MSSEESFWYRVGYAVESAKLPAAPGEGKRSDADRPGPRGRRPARAGTEPLLGEDLLTAGATALAVRLLDAWQPRRTAGFKRLLWAGAAGAGAALLLDVVKPIMRGQPELPSLDMDTADRLLAGVGQGLVYATVVEPRLPGPAVLKGALFASAEYAADAAGGLTHLLGAHSPFGRLPFLGRMLEDADPHDRAYLEHLVFGIALALLYGSSPVSNGAPGAAQDV
jgi:hypothetical protein